MSLDPDAETPIEGAGRALTIGLRHTPDSWRDYLYWNVELDET